MFKKVFWGIIALMLVLVVLANSHRVPFFYLYGKKIDISLDLIIVLSFAAGILSFLITGFIGKSQEFFKGLLSYSLVKKKKKLESIFKEAVNCIKLGNLRRSKELLAAYLKEEAENIDAYLYLSDIYLKEGLTLDAEETLKRASVVSKNDVKILLKLSDVYIQSKKFNKAIKILDEIKEKEDDKAFYLKKIYDTYIMLKDYEAAYKIQEELEKDESFIDLKDDFLVTRYNLTLALIKDGKYEDAKVKLKNIMENDKRFYGAYVSFAEILYNEGDYEGAYTFLSESYNDTKFPYFAKMIEKISLKEEKPVRALTFYQQQIERISLGTADSSGSQAWMDSQALIVYALYINLLLKLEMIDYAIEAINYIVGTEDDKNIFHYFLAECYLRHDKYEESAKQYSTYLRKWRRHPIMLICNNCGSEYEEFKVVCTNCDTYNKINYFVN